MNSVSQIAGNCKVMVDFGCGTGFLEELAPDNLRVIYGVDVTEAMLEILRNKKLPRVEIVRAPVEDVPLPDGIADIITGYSVLDHFEDPRSVFEEAARLLRPGGVFYMDLIPNGEFWRGLRGIHSGQDGLHPIVQREILEVANHGRKMYERYGVSQEVLDGWILRRRARVISTLIRFCRCSDSARVVPRRSDSATR
jgi:SAM-dependent methyltransferase